MQQLIFTATACLILLGAAISGRAGAALSSETPGAGVPAPAAPCKEAVVNPTNLAHRTTDWEADVVAFFRGQADTQSAEIGLDITRCRTPFSKVCA